MSGWWRSKTRGWIAWIALGRSILCDRAIVIIDQVPECAHPEEEKLWENNIANALHVVARPEAEYQKSELPIVLEIPEDCNYWVDDEKVVVTKHNQDRICPECHSLLEENELALYCIRCERIWEKKA